MVIQIADTVDIGRRLEILEGWRWLWNGLRDRDILAGGNFAGILVFSSCPVNGLREEERKTTGDNTIVLDGDIAIALSPNLTALNGSETLNCMFSISFPSTMFFIS